MAKAQGRNKNQLIYWHNFNRLARGLYRPGNQSLICFLSSLLDLKLSLSFLNFHEGLLLAPSSESECCGGLGGAGEEGEERGGELGGVWMSAIAMQWEVVLKIPIDTWAPTHKQGHRQTHTSWWPKRCHSCTTAQGKHTQTKPNLTQFSHTKIIKVHKVIIIYGITELENSESLWVCIGRTLFFRGLCRALFHTQAQVLCANKPSCHIVTLGRRNMGKLLCTHCVECSLWQILFFRLPHAETLLGQFAERWSPEEKRCSVLFTELLQKMRMW